jgi:hypothetical protein
MNWVLCSNYGWKGYEKKTNVQTTVVSLRDSGHDLNEIIIFNREDSDFQTGSSFLEDITLKGMVEHNGEALTKLIIDCRKIVDEEGIALDGDVVETIAKFIHAWIDFHEGNTTEDEYERV